MSKLNVEQELTELITRFKALKKALQEEDGLTSAQRAATEAANQFRSGQQLDKATVLRKAKEFLEQRHAQNLANQLQQKGILGGGYVAPQPTTAQQEAWLRSQGFANEEMAKAQDANWGNSINNWLNEASKPLNARFSSKEEEENYWNSIKVNGSGGDGGY